MPPTYNPTPYIADNTLPIAIGVTAGAVVFAIGIGFFVMNMGSTSTIASTEAGLAGTSALSGNAGTSGADAAKTVASKGGELSPLLGPV